MIIYDDIISDMLSNKKVHQITAELFIRGRKVNTSLAFTIQSYFAVQKNITLNSKHSFIMKIPNEQESQ